MYIDDFTNFNSEDEYFRDFNSEDENFDDPSYLYELETYDLPYGCPYRQMLPFPFGQQGSPFGPPGQQQGPPFGPPGQQQGPQGQQGAPKSPPPNFTPSQAPKTFQGQGGPSVQFVDPGSIRPCTFRFVFIWPRRGRGFWAWLTFVGRRSVSGFRWNGRRWVYFGMDLRNIDSFQCY
jgi:hypothetical protein